MRQREVRPSGQGSASPRPDGGPLVGAALSRFEVLALVPAAFIILLVACATGGFMGEAIIGVVASQVGYLLATLIADDPDSAAVLAAYAGRRTHRNTYKLKAMILHS
jgi:hypothetical protein